MGTPREDIPKNLIKPIGSQQRVDELFDSFVAYFKDPTFEYGRPRAVDRDAARDLLDGTSKVADCDILTTAFSVLARDHAKGPEGPRFTRIDRGATLTKAGLRPIIFHAYNVFSKDGACNRFLFNDGHVFCSIGKKYYDPLFGLGWDMNPGEDPKNWHSPVLPEHPAHPARGANFLIECDSFHVVQYKEEKRTLWASKRKYENLAGNVGDAYIPRSNPDAIYQAEKSGSGEIYRRVAVDELGPRAMEELISYCDEASNLDKRLEKTGQPSSLEDKSLVELGKRLKAKGASGMRKGPLAVAAAFASKAATSTPESR